MRTRTKLLLLAVLLLPCAAGASRWYGQIKLEVTGTVFPTLPYPLATVRLHTVHQTPDTLEDRASASGSVEMNLSVEDAQQLGQALLDWSASPTTTTIYLKAR